MVVLESKSNPVYQHLKALAQDNHAARQQNRVWLEGDHLLSAAIQRGYPATAGVATREGWEQFKSLGQAVPERQILLSAKLWQDISQIKSTREYAVVVDLPADVLVDPLAPTVILDRVQDPGNVGSILRSASAFGYKQVLALTGTAALWSPKVVRSAMGAHFGLRLLESLTLAQLEGLKQVMCVTSSHDGHLLNEIVGVGAKRPLAWIFGNEGQGVAQPLMALAERKVRIDQPGGEESLNVAAAAAICLYSTRLES